VFRKKYFHWFATILVALIFVSAGCMDPNDNELVVYSALDREFSLPIMGDLAEEMTLTILPKFDVESNKTVGLVTTIISEASRPRCDVFWNNEILHTIRLQELGLLETYRSIESQRFPNSFVSASNQWHGFAARARVLIVNTDLIPDLAERPSSVLDLADPKWKSKCAMARPLFGTTATHAAVLFSTMGEAQAKSFFQDVATNAAIEGGNKQVAQKVANGQYAFGITDTDDAIIEIEDGRPVVIVFPDQQPKQTGALLIPNTLCIIKNGPNTIRAKKFVDRLLASDIETRLAKGPSGQIPLAEDVELKSRVEPESELKIMEVDFHAAAKAWDRVKAEMEELFPLGAR
jgi:iron(III) transport system substrate-binding protein